MTCAHCHGRMDERAVTVGLGPVLVRQCDCDRLICTSCRRAIHPLERTACNRCGTALPPWPGAKR